MRHRLALVAGLVLACLLVAVKLATRTTVPEAHAGQASRESTAGGSIKGPRRGGTMTPRVEDRGASEGSFLDPFISQLNRALFAFLILLAVVAPIVAGGIAYEYDTGQVRLVLEALIGKWPDDEVVRSTGQVGRALGVGLSAFAVFGVPAVVGVAVTLLVTKLQSSTAKKLLELEQKIEAQQMDIKRYLQSQRMYVQGRLPGVLAQELRRQGLDETAVAGVAEAADKAVTRIFNDWQEHTPQVIGEVSRTGGSSGQVKAMALGD
jgi:uncharacterized membrane protein